MGFRTMEMFQNTAFEWNERAVVKSDGCAMNLPSSSFKLISFIKMECGFGAFHITNETCRMYPALEVLLE